MEVPEQDDHVSLKRKRPEKEEAPNDGSEEETEELFAEEEECTLSETQKIALDAIVRGENVFVTGKAGSGKSYLIGKIKERLAALGKTYYVTAATGSAAYNVAGMTLHSYAGIGLGDKDLSYHLKNIKSNGGESLARWKDTEVLIIDETSMISPLFFEKISSLAKNVRNRKTSAFGAIQIVLVADMFQLPPVPPRVDPNQKVLAKVENHYVFQTPTWRELNLTSIKLDVNFRQQGDEKFANFLNNIRVGILEKEEEAIIQSRDITRHALNVPENATKLFAYRNDVLRTNQEELTKIKSASLFYDAELYECATLRLKRARYEGSDASNIQPDTNNTKFPVDTRIELKVGASVLLCFNMCQPAGLYNGTRGVIIKFLDIEPKVEKGEDNSIKLKKNGKIAPKEVIPVEGEKQGKFVYPLVQFDNGEKRVIRPHTWSQYEGKKLVSSFTQIPLVLSYALTIHRSQGLTLNAALVNMKVFSTGQLYVALSRVRRLEDLYLTNTGVKQNVLADKNVIAFYEKHNLL